MWDGTSLSRRSFLAATAKTGAVLALPQLIPGSALGKDGQTAPSERIVVGAIGIGPRGREDLSHMLNEPVVRFVAIADVQASRREAVKAMADGHYGNQDCVMYRDFRELLARDDIDAVLIATGDRWHSLASITAAKAGKDIYCEKPCSMTIAESRALADTVRQYARVYQAGTQRRNIGNFVYAIELARTGQLGKLHTVYANTLPPGTRHDWLPGEPEPPRDLVDWDLWLGPCPWRPYHSSHAAGGWRGFFDFHGGGILEWGSHTVDLCQWASDADNTAPVEYEPSGNDVNTRYANGVKLIMRLAPWLGLGSCSVRFEGDAGWVETGDSGKMEVSDSLRAKKKIFDVPGTSPGEHIRDFLRCVKSRSQPRANASVAAQSHVACHAAYIAWQLGRKLSFDPAKDEFIGDDEANRMRSRAMREPWRT